MLTLINEVLFLPLFAAEVSSTERPSNSKVWFQPFHRIVHSAIHVLSHGFSSVFGRARDQRLDKMFVAAHVLLLGRSASNAVPRRSERVGFLDSDA